MKARKEPLIEELHGETVSDPYRWLEDAENPEVQEWITQQNRDVDAAIKDDTFEKISQELAATFKVVNFSCPTPAKGKYFYRERQPDEDQWVIYMKDGLDGEPVRLVDPNGRREGNTTTIDFAKRSSNGNYLAYGLSEGGNEMATLYVKDTRTREELPDVIPNCRYSSVCWLPDETGFFYTRNPRPGTVPKNEEHLHDKVYLHMLGSDPDDDELIFGEGRPKDDMLEIRLSPDGRYLGIQASQTWTEEEVHIYDRETKELRPLVTDVPAKFLLRFAGDKVLLKTNHGANNFRVLQSSYEQMFRPIGEWQEFVPESKDLLESVFVTRDKVLVEYLENACSKMSVFDHDGNETGTIPLPPYSSLTNVSAVATEEEFFYGVHSFTFPHKVYRFDPGTGQYAPYRETENPIDPRDYDVTQEWCISKDGTEIPLFLIRKKGKTDSGNASAILYGYGGFGSNVTPFFVRSWVPWLKRGGIFAVANIRGGGEFGDRWHKEGVKEKKQNSFDDFIAAAEHLISRGYTDAGRLGIVGGSNGGLLVAAVAVQRPELFSAVCSRVPLTDMVRFHKFGIAMRWVHEYGDPETPEDLKRILSWSPYHNVREGVEHPAFLFTTADKDTRVDPLHARKMAARLSEASTKNPVLVLTEMEAGHGPGKPVAKIVESQALALAFFAKYLGLDDGLS